MEKFKTPNQFLITSPFGGGWGGRDDNDTPSPRDDDDDPRDDTDNNGGGRHEQNPSGYDTADTIGDFGTEDNDPHKDDYYDTIDDDWDSGGRETDGQYKNPNKETGLDDIDGSLPNGGSTTGGNGGDTSDLGTIMPTWDDIMSQLDNLGEITDKKKWIASFMDLWNTFFRQNSSMGMWNDMSYSDKREFITMMWNNMYQFKLAEYNNAVAMRNWYLQNEYNSPLEQIKRFAAAGINPVYNNQLNSGNAQGTAQTTPAVASAAYDDTGSELAETKRNNELNNISSIIGTVGSAFSGIAGGINSLVMTPAQKALAQAQAGLAEASKMDIAFTQQYKVAELQQDWDKFNFELQQDWNKFVGGDKTQRWSKTIDYLNTQSQLDFQFQEMDINQLSDWFKEFAPFEEEFVYKRLSDGYRVTSSQDAELYSQLNSALGIHKGTDRNSTSGGQFGANLGANVGGALGGANLGVNSNDSHSGSVDAHRGLDKNTSKGSGNKTTKSSSNEVTYNGETYRQYKTGTKLIDPSKLDVISSLYRRLRSLPTSTMTKEQKLLYSDLSSQVTMWLEDYKANYPAYKAHTYTNSMMSGLKKIAEDNYEQMQGNKRKKHIYEYDDY